MPHITDGDLPERAQQLPEHARHIYRRTFSSAYEQYQIPDIREDSDGDRKASADRVAWAAVAQGYHQEGARWVRNTPLGQQRSDA